MHERIDPTETQFPGSTSESQPISAPAPLLSSGLTSAAAQLPTTSPFSAPVPGLPNVFAAAELDSLKTVSLIIDGISLGLIVIAIILLLWIICTMTPKKPIAFSRASPSSEPDQVPSLSGDQHSITSIVQPRSTWQPPKISTSHNWTDRQAAETLDGHPMTAFDQCRSTNR
ncbi:hypothetical protein niasHT_017407 [Heterodera trifolii]|uniref:Uncharacterized protein n=1 Tax=Heterodera trifolii TaxID=157864 RepID=A0ABD2KWK6_9BILA